MGMGKFLVGSAVSWFLGGKFHSGRTAKKLKTKFQKEQKELYSQYYNDVYKLTEQNSQLQTAVKELQAALRELEEKHELEGIQRDYDEFKQPDIDGDDRISRAEFNMYVKNYLANYPGLQEKDYPRFEDFDHDGACVCGCGWERFFAVWETEQPPTRTIRCTYMNFVFFDMESLPIMFFSLCSR
jgi:hypothetical protein